MTRAEAKKRLLGFCLIMLTQDDEAAFGEVYADQESQEYKALSEARQELIDEFNRRGAQ